MARSLHACLLLLVPACGGAAAPAPPAAAPAPQVPHAPPAFCVPDGSWQEDGFSLSIKRTFADADMAGLIRRAEAEMPPREDVLELIGDEARQERAGVIEGEPLWWHARFDGVRIPYAITCDGLAYYAGVVEAMRSGDSGPSMGIVMQKASLAYEASVSHEQAFEHGGRTFADVHVVRMDLGWFQFCGLECAMGFHKERIVLFDAEGRIVAVLLDGETPYMVS